MSADIDVILPFHVIDQYFFLALDSLANSQNVELRIVLVDDTHEQVFDPSFLTSKFKSIELVRTGGGQGYGLALGEAAKFIESESVGLFNSDDLVSPTRFRKQLEALDNADLSISAMQRISKSGKRSSSLTGEISSKEFDPIYLLFGSHGANATWVARKNWWKEKCFFDSSECLDWRIGLETFLDSNIHWSSEKLYFYRRHRGQLTSRRDLSDQSMDPVYTSWKRLGAQLGIKELSRPTFKMIATPWLDNQEFNYAQLELALNELLVLASMKSDDVYRNVVRLVRRRYLNFSVNSDEKFQERFRVFIKALPEVPSVSRDFLIQLRS